MCSYDKKNGIPFDTDSNKLLVTLTFFGVLSNAFSLFLAGESRPRRDAIEKNLLEEGNKMLQLLQSIEGSAPLVHHLIGQSNQIISTISGILERVDAVLSTIPPSVLTGLVTHIFSLINRA